MLIPHVDSGERCLVAHFKYQGQVLAPCIKCARCDQWLRPEQFNQLTCEG